MFYRSAPKFIYFFLSPCCTSPKGFVKIGFVHFELSRRQAHQNNASNSLTSLAEVQYGLQANKSNSKYWDSETVSHVSSFHIPSLEWIISVPLRSISACSPSFDEELSPRPKAKKKKKKRKSERKRKRRRSVSLKMRRRVKSADSRDVCVAYIYSAPPTVGLPPAASRRWGRRKRRRRRAPGDSNVTGSSGLQWWWWWRYGPFTLSDRVQFIFSVLADIPPRSPNTGMYMHIWA